MHKTKTPQKKLQSIARRPGEHEVTPRFSIGKEVVKSAYLTASTPSAIKVKHEMILPDYPERTWQSLFISAMASNQSALSEGLDYCWAKTSAAGN
jgi:hypothetical protein